MKTTPEKLEELKALAEDTDISLIDNLTARLDLLHEKDTERIQAFKEYVPALIADLEEARGMAVALDPEAARKLFVQAGIYTEEGNLREAFGGTMNKEKVMDQTNYSYTNKITLPAERSNKWQLKLFGKGSNFIYIPPLSHEPTWFVRMMCRYLLDCHWVRIDKSEV